MIYQKYNAIFRVDDTRCLIHVESHYMKPIIDLLTKNFPDLQFVQPTSLDFQNCNMDQVFFTMLKYCNDIGYKNMIIDMNDIMAFEFTLMIKDLLHELPVNYYDTVTTEKLMNGETL